MSGLSKAGDFKSQPRVRAMRTVATAHRRTVLQQRLRPFTIARLNARPSVKYWSFTPPSVTHAHTDRSHDPAGTDDGGSIVRR